MNYKIDSDIIGLDLGQARTGVARIHPVARIAEPLEHIVMKDGDFTEAVESVVAQHMASCVVVGMPRGLNGQETDQTKWAQQMQRDLESSLQVPVFAIDEAVTTQHAEKRARPDQSIDSVAAGIIAEDFVHELAEGRIENASI